MYTEEVLPTFLQKDQDIAKLNRWIFDIIYPYVKGRTLELGSANGGISAMFIERNLPIHLTDEHSVNRLSLQKRFAGAQSIRVIHDISFDDPLFDRVYADNAGVFLTLIAVNIAEHGYYKAEMIRRSKYFLQVGGHFMLAMASNAVLFHKSDSWLQDLKQYNLKEVQKFMGDEFEILKMRFFNLSVDSHSLDNSHLNTLAIFKKK